MFYIAQLFGIIGLVILIISFQKDDKEKLLKYQIYSSLFFAIQYLCLNATTGALMNLMAGIRNIVYKKFDNKVPGIYVTIIVGAMFGLSMLSYNGIISLLPAIAIGLYSISLAQKNLTITRITEVFSCCLFIIYNIKVVAISGIISIGIEMISVIIAIYKLDIKEKNIFKLYRKKYVVTE